MADDPNAVGSGGDVKPDAGAGTGQGAGAGGQGDAGLKGDKGGTEGKGDTGDGLGKETLLGKGAGKPADGAEKPAGDGKDPAAGDGKGDDKKEPEKGKDDDPAAKVPDKPEGYELKFKEDTHVDEGMLEGFKSTAHELGLTQGQVQKLAAMYEERAAKAGEAAHKAYVERLNKAQAEWESRIKADKDFEQKLTLATQALRQFGSDELNAVMDQTRIGSFPAFFNFVAAVGKALAEPEAGGSGAGGQGQEKPLADRLWPGMK
jgi:hypothetical protein